MVSDKVLQHLTSIFKAVADACDTAEYVGRFHERDMTDIHKAYREAMKDPEVQAFYGELVNESSVVLPGEEPDA